MFLFFNLPTESQKFVVDGNLEAEQASPGLGGGVLYNILNTPLNNNSIIKLDFTFSPLVMGDSWKNLAASAVYGLRFYIGKSDGFFMYTGLSRTLGVNGNMLWYGVGQSF